MCPATEPQTEPSPSPPKRPVRRLALLILGTVAAVYLLLCLGVFLLQESLIYFPDPDYAVTPADAAMPFDEITLRTADGLSLAAWYVPADHPRATVLFCHGNAGNLSHRLLTIQEFRRLGCNVLIFDYRGYGQSEGEPGEQGTYRDAEAAWRYLTEARGETPDRIVIFGRSLGGAVATELALACGPPAALIIESSFTSLPDVGRRQYPYLPVRWLCRHRYASVGKVGRITCPKLFIYARDDELVPIDNGRKLFQAAARPKQFIETPGTHNTGGFTYAPRYTQRVGEFLDRYLPRWPDRPPFVPPP